MAGVVGVSGADGEGAVELLGGNDGGELMGERYAAEGDGLVGALAGGGRPPVGWANGQDEGLDASIEETGDDHGELCGRDLLAGGVGEQQKRTGARGGISNKNKQFLLCDKSALCRWGVAGAATQIVLLKLSRWCRCADPLLAYESEDKIHKLTLTRES